MAHNKCKTTKTKKKYIYTYVFICIYDELSFPQKGTYNYKGIGCEPKHLVSPPRQSGFVRFLKIPIRLQRPSPSSSECTPLLPRQLAFDQKPFRVLYFYKFLFLPSAHPLQFSSCQQDPLRVFYLYSFLLL